jgi:hypothetical protein
MSLAGPKRVSTSQSQSTTVSLRILADKIVLTGLTPNAAVPSEYINENLVVAQERITLGGYRLAYLIEYMFEPGEA